MRLISLAGMAGAALALSGAPAEAAWEYYITHQYGFSFTAPGELTITRGTYEAPVAGTLNSVVIKSSEAGVDYQVTVIDMTAEQKNAATLFYEAAYNFQDGKRVLMDAVSRADRHFGRKLTVELPGNAGRSTGQYYFVDGRLLEMRTTISAGGDFGSPDIARFIDSVAFYSDMANPESVELSLPELQ